ncbi:MFS transporter [Candidatus Tisiphia endosymbiont of Ceraclea dissimilis]|uniref:MFS transporter n=1 Tax=Candidatus Tisiphia endosymbiont of Ceraclea dissimilis TaxID=3077928 RepID=UPI003CCA76F5
MSELVQENTRITHTSLTREQKEAIGLLSIGTFLEYFDLMLYVHMAVLLNELFFEPTDPKTASLMTAFAFCSTYILRPVGALIFGWIGDNIGRKATVIITTFLMSFSCLIMANLPTYAQIGITASYVITICRILQGMSSMGEVVGAELYLTELIKPPMQYPVVAFLAIAISIGTTAALGVATFTMSIGLNWRGAFWIGAGIAVVGAVARTTLRETPEFANAKHRVKQNIKLVINTNVFEKTLIWNEKVNIKTALSNFALISTWPIWFYTTYVYSSNILKNTFKYTTEQIISHNLGVSMISMLNAMLLTYLSYKIHPLKILKIRLIVFAVVILPCPYLLNNLTNVFELWLFQLIVIILGPTGFPAVPILYKHFPVFKRFTYSTVIYALSRALIYVITSFGFVYLIEYFSHWGLLVIIIPALTIYYYGRNHFEGLEMSLSNHEIK